MMEKKKYIYFFDNDMWLGYWEEFPDYMTQGVTLEELQTNLKDLPGFDRWKYSLCTPCR